jgi:hypothetical protein
MVVTQPQFNPVEGATLLWNQVKLTPKSAGQLRFGHYVACCICDSYCEGEHRRPPAEEFRNRPLSIQDSATFALKKFHNLLNLVRLDAHLVQRFTKVVQKPIEVDIV